MTELRDIQPKVIGVDLSNGTETVVEGYLENGVWHITDIKEYYQGGRVIDGELSGPKLLSAAPRITEKENG